MSVDSKLTEYNERTANSNHLFNRRLTKDSWRMTTYGERTGYDRGRIRYRHGQNRFRDNIRSGTGIVIGTGTGTGTGKETGTRTG